ncbi:MAG: hypothetical protein MPJ78_08685 [Hyphomicrobiaceae bacterium]|nr:hypothetical protein [Hyphomicrobiaceae bacterium]
MADTDNKQVAVQTLSEPSEPNPPNLQQAPEATQPVEFPDAEQTPAEPEGPDREQSSTSPAAVQPSSGPETERPEEGNETQKPVSAPDAFANTGESAITPPIALPGPERSPASQDTDGTAAISIVAQSADFQASKQPVAAQSTEQMAASPDTVQSVKAPITEATASGLPDAPPNSEQTDAEPESEQSAEEPTKEAPAKEEIPGEPGTEQSAEDADADKPDLELAARIKKLERRIRRTVTKARRVTQHGSERAKATAGPALSRTAAGLRKGGERGGLALGALYRERLKPYLADLRKNLASRLTSQALARDYRRLLLFAHRHGPDRAIEQQCFVPTSEHIPLSIVRVPHQLRRSGHDYRPSPRLVFKWAMEMLPDPVERHEFIDYGAGRGRVLLMASNYPFEKITGAEIAEELANDCRLNIAQYPRSLMKCRDVNCEHLSALRLPIPEERTVFYFNNPFARSMLERVITQIVKSYKNEPRPLFVICVDMDADDLMEDTGVFIPIPAPMAQRLKIGTLSPYSITVYRTIYQAPSEDEDDDRDDEDDAEDAERNT